MPQAPRRRGWARRWRPDAAARRARRIWARRRARRQEPLETPPRMREATVHEPGADYRSDGRTANLHTGLSVPAWGGSAWTCRGAPSDGGGLRGAPCDGRGLKDVPCCNAEGGPPPWHLPAHGPLCPPGISDAAVRGIRSRNMGGPSGWDCLPWVLGEPPLSPGHREGAPSGTWLLSCAARAARGAMNCENRRAARVAMGVAERGRWEPKAGGPLPRSAALSHPGATMMPGPTVYLRRMWHASACGCGRTGRDQTAPLARAGTLAQVWGRGNRGAHCHRPCGRPERRRGNRSAHCHWPYGRLGPTR